MKLKSGQVVIKTTGGNKMTIWDVVENGYNCIWFDESYHQSFFEKDEIVSIDDYKRFLISEERQDKINKILN